MVTRVNLKTARILIQYNDSNLLDLREFVSPSGKFRIVFSLAVKPGEVCHFTTDYVTSVTAHRFMCSL